MCGIFGYVGDKKQPASMVLDGLKSLEYRGYDSWGVAVVGTQGIEVKKRVGKIGGASVDELPDSTIEFGHTRWATHGGVTQLNAHPHLDCTGTIALIHNGIVENYEVLKRGLLEKGHTFQSETDSEVIVHFIEEYAKTDEFSEAVRHAFLNLEGMNAIIAMRNHENTFVALRNGSPLVIGFGKHANYLASDPAALLPHTKSVYFLEDGDMAIVTAGSVQVQDSKTKKLIPIHSQVIPWDIAQTMKGSYPFFLPKEIHEQPRVLTALLESSGVQMRNIADRIRKAKNTYLVGCGTASYACMVGSYLFSTVAGREAKAVVASEMAPELQFVTQDTVILALSQSGETMDLLEMVKLAKQKGATIIALVNVVGSSLYRLADEKLLMGAGPEKAVATTKDFTAKIATLVLLAYALSGKLKTGKAALSRAIVSLQGVLTEDYQVQIKQLAKQLKNKEHLYVIGKGISYPLALETALKIKEISYIHAEGLASGELKHGPLALVENGTSCIVMLPNDETYYSGLAGAMEMKARGASIVGISYAPHPVFDTYLPVSDAGASTIIPNVVVAQLLAYELTIERGLDPDMPRNLAKSVTVQ